MNDGKKKNSNYNKKYTGNKKRKMDYISQVTKDIKLDWKSEKKFVDYLYTETGALYQTPNIYTLNTVVTGPEYEFVLDLRGQRPVAIVKLAQ